MSAITLNAGHGAGLGGVMQNAIAFGYCVKHKAVAMSPSLFKKYAGHYVYYEDRKKEAEVNVWNKDGRLYMKWNDPKSLPDELLPANGDKFFTPVNERMEFQFNTNELIITELGSNKQYRLVKE
jgi:hypothetical protein